MGKLWKHDIREGLEMNRGALLLMFFTLLASFVLFLSERHGLQEMAGVDGTFSLGDVLWYLNRGTLFDAQESDFQEYQLPIVWFFQMVVFHQIVGYYPLRDWQKCGIQVLLRSGSRRKWWCAKAFWVLGMTILFSLIQVVVLGIAALVSGGSLSLGWNEVGLFMGADFAGLEITPSAWMPLVCLIVTPCLVRLALGLCQMTLMFVAGPFWAFLCLMLYDLAATCLPSWWLLANYSMGYRMGRIPPFFDGGTELRKGSILCAVLMGAAFLIGLIYIRRKDILGREEAE